MNVYLNCFLIFNYIDMSLVNISSDISLFNKVVLGCNVCILSLFILICGVVFINFKGFTAAKKKDAYSLIEDGPYVYGICEDCKKRQALKEDARIILILTKALGAERTKILYAAGHLGEISWFEFYQLKARLWHFDGCKGPK